MWSKPYWTSKTLWFNILSLILSILDNAYFGGLVPNDIKVVIVTVINLALRFLTDLPLTASRK